MFKFFDAHTHLQSPDFNKDREEVIQRIFDANIGVINVGADKNSSLKAVELAKKYPDKMRATIGCHPHYIEEFDYDFFKKLAGIPEVVAIGECGLDYYCNQENQNSQGKLCSPEEAELKIKEKQKEIFIKHIELAKEVGKPLMIHCRKAFDDLIEILESNVKGQRLNVQSDIIHFFTGSLEDAKKLLEMRFYFTFNGLITHNRDFDEIIKYIPLEKILLETDAPYVAPLSHRGKRNEPAYIIETAQKMAEIKGVSLEKVAEQTTENTIKVFNIL